LAQHGQAQFLGLLERDGVRTRSIVGPARKYRQTRECFEKRGPNPAPAILIGSGVLSLSRRQLFANAAIAASRVAS
jgi:hypothetical protein